MPYNNPSPSQSTTLTPVERAKEARRILTMLREESKDDLKRKLTPKAINFVQTKWLEMDWGGKLEGISPDQYHWLQDIWQNFA
ncbi:MAG TPA: hypothetical protein VMQ76_05300 [Terracidiphilus sp.]|nr:hypothetical protein [Terracidiphilus sp.]